MKYISVSLLMVLGMPLTALAAVEPSLLMQSSASTVSVGQTVTVTVMISAQDRTVSAATVEVRYPADKLEGVSIDKGNFFSSGLGTATIDNAAGRMMFSAGTNPAKTGTGAAFTLVFRGKAVGSAPLTFGSSTGVAVTENISSVVLGVATPVSLSVVAGSGIVSPTLTPTPTAYYTPAQTVYYTPVPTVYYTPIPTSVASVAQVKTGPGETTILALIVGSIVSLLYVGYTGSDAFRRREASSYAEDARKNPTDFRS